jgi:hypothetical protein
MRTLFSLVGLSLGLALLLPAAPTAAQDKDGWTPLFNGKDLTGWKPFLRPSKDGKSVDPKDVWSVQDGYIRCVGKPNGYIATEKEYGDYVLKVKWRFPKDGKGGNSGVLLHVQQKDEVWPTSIEAQMFAGRAGDFWLIYPPAAKLDVDPARQDPKQARHYFRIPKDQTIEKPFGEWNQYEITCKGGDVTLVVNGTKANEGRNGNLTKGRIALQSEGAEVHFKDVEIRFIR